VIGPRLSPKARLKWDARERRYLLLYPERGLALSDTASAILKLCDGAHSLDAIADALLRTSPASDRQAILDDVAAFLGEMQRRGLVIAGAEAAPSSPAPSSSPPRGR
jgi:coenzyme PQQ biosynthesis protein PqqD